MATISAMQTLLYTSIQCLLSWRPFVDVIENGSLPVTMRRTSAGAGMDIMNACEHCEVHVLQSASRAEDAHVAAKCAVHRVRVLLEYLKKCGESSDIAAINNFKDVDICTS